MYVCMSVRNGFTTEVYEFTYGLRTLLARAPLGALELRGVGQAHVHSDI